MRASSANFGDFMSAYEDVYFQQPYEELRGVVAPEYEHLPPGQLEHVLRAQMGDVSPEAMEDFLSTLAQVGQAVLPVLLPAVGTVIGGPIGGVIGGVAGQAASGAIGAATAKKKPAKAAHKPPPARQSTAPKPAARPPAKPPTAPAPPTPPSSLVPVPVMHPSQPAVPVISPASSSASNPAAQLLTLLFRPEFMQALTAMMLGSAGRNDIPVGGKDVPVGAFANLLGVLADQLAVSHHTASSSFSDGIPEYLVEADGEMKCDLSVPEERAQVLWELLQEDAGKTTGASHNTGFLDPDMMAWEMMQGQFFNPYAFAEYYDEDEDY